jgi:hypothetical protein
MTALNPSVLNLPAFDLPLLNVLAESAVRSLLLGLLAWGALRLLRVRHAGVEKQAWTGVLLLALAMPLLVALRIPRVTLRYEWMGAVWSGLHPAAAQPEAVLEKPEAVLNRTAAVHVRTVSGPAVGPAVLPAAWPGGEALPPAAQQSDTSAVPVPLPVPVPPGLRSTTAAAAVHAPFPWGLFGVLVYSLISAGLLLRIGVGLVLAAWMWRRAESFPVQETALPVRLTAELKSPVTLGRGILLPLEAAEWEAATLRTTLAHEAAHIRAGDFFLQLAASLHLALFWISPLSWWLPAELSRLSEIICDRAALQAAGDGLSYAQLLLRFAGAGRAPSRMLAMAQPGGLQQRIEQLIADPQLAGSFRQRRGQGTAALLLVGVAAAASAATIRILDPMPRVLAAHRVAIQGPAALQAPTPPEPAQPPPAPSPAPAPAAAQRSTPPAPAPAPTPAVPAIAPAPEPAAAPALQAAPPPADAESGVWISSDGTPGHSFAILSSDGDATFTFSGGAAHPSGEWRQLRREHPGGVIWFQRDGKSYVIDDPALVKQAREAYAPAQQLGRKQGELGKKQGALGEEQGKLGEQQGEIGAMQGDWGAKQAELAQNFKFDMPPEFADAIAQLTEAATRLGFDHDQLDASQRAALEAQKQQAQATIDKVTAELRAQQPQREAMEKQIREQTEQMRKQMEPMMKQMTELARKQSAFAVQQEELGRQQALLGQQQRKVSREAQEKVQQLIEQAMREGKARPAP